MPRTFREKLKDPNWWLEHAAHGWLGAAPALVGISIVRGLGGAPWLAVVVAVVLAAIVAVVRELVQNLGDKDNDVLDAIADALFTTLGGVLVAIPDMVAWSVE